MHYVPLGFRGPSGAPTETASGIPIVSYTSTSGWAARPIHATGYYQPTIVAQGETTPQYDSGVSPYAPISYTRQQLQDMLDRAMATRGELTDQQRYESGDGLARDLEQKAAEANATDKAIETDLPSGGGVAKPNLIPLAIAAALIFFMK